MRRGDQSPAYCTNCAGRGGLLLSPLLLLLTLPLPGLSASTPAHYAVARNTSTAPLATWQDEPVTSSAACSSPSRFLPGQCSSSNATEIVTLDINTTAGCCAACGQQPGCETWTLKSREGQPTKCYLKGAMHGAFRLSSSCISGIVDPPAPTPAPPAPRGAKSVLFLVVDDMRPMMNHAYNFSLAHTPHLDELSRTGLTFTRAYTQYSFCSPSRNSFMSGRRPDTTKVWEFVDNFRERGVGENWTALPQWFKEHSYLSLGGGKLFHRISPANDFPNSWSEQYPYFAVPQSDSYTCNFSDARQAPHGSRAGGGEPGGTYCAANVDKDDATLTDQKIRDNCIQHLELASRETMSNRSSPFFGKPFFIACGFIRPHTPWHVPLEFFDLLPPPADIPLAANLFAPQGMPMAAWHPPADVKNMALSPPFNGTCNHTLSRLYRRAYYASVAFSDYNIGKVLGALGSLGMYNSTLVVVFSDHGWQLGEHDTWSKMTNFELGVHVPLIIRAPWKVHSIGQRTNVLAELVDLYPTLSSLAGLPDPRSAGEALNGTTLEPVFDEPCDLSRELVGAAIKNAAFSQFAKRNLTDVHPEFNRSETKLMGYSIRTSNWRYTAWFAFDVLNMRPITDGSPGSVLGTELYDHAGDTGMWLDFPGEERNMVNDVEHGAVVAELHQKVLDYIQLR